MAQKLIEGSLVVHCKAEEMKQNIINVTENDTSYGIRRRIKIQLWKGYRIGP